MPEPEVDAAATYARAKEALAGGEAGIGQLGAAAERLREIAPEIGTILGSSEVSAHLGTYARCDEEAVRQQSRLFWETTAANLCLLAAAVLSSCVLAVPAIQATLGETWTPRLLLAIGLTALLLGALAALYGYRAREGNRLLRWLNMRGRAEVARIDTFRAIAHRAAAAGPVAAAAGLALFCRHLFLEQRDWLVGRAQRHRVSSDVTNRWGGLATALTFLGGSAATIAAFQDKMSWLALAGVVGTAFMAFALNREGLRRDRANADRYEEKAVALDQLSTRTRRGGGRDRRRAPRGADRVRRPGHGRAGDRAQAVARWHQAGRGRAWRAWMRGSRSCARHGPRPDRRWSCRCRSPSASRNARARRGRTGSWCRG